MKDITIHLRVPLYLRQWLVARFGSPVRFPPRSAENALLRSLLTRPGASPTDIPGTPDEGVRIVIPDARLHKPEHYHHLTRRARAILLAHLDDLFRLQLWRDLMPALLAQGGLCSALEDWCRTNGIGVDGLDAVTKKFYRMRREYAHCGIILGRRRSTSSQTSPSAQAV